VRRAGSALHSDHHCYSSLKVERVIRSLASLLIAVILLLPAPDEAAAQQDTIPRVRLDAVLVSSTRTGRRVEDEPLRVEVVGREEIEEKLLMTPGDITMLLNETGGVRVQATSPALGGAAVRIQGLRGRYAQILSDGLPLYGEAVGLGPLQIPPMDLAQVEVIKGPASALYGAAALGGVINLIPRRPDGERELLLNATTRGGFDGVFWLASDEAARVGWTVVGGGHAQSRQDLSRDGWADIPDHRRVTLRPRLFVGDERASLMLTTGAMIEERVGGFASAPDRNPDVLESRRVDAGGIGSLWLGGRRVSTRISAAQSDHVHTYAGRREEDRHRTLFGEVSVSSLWRGHTWVAGVAVQHTDDRHFDVIGFDKRLTMPGVFVQQEWSAGGLVAFSASARADHSRDHGTLLSPRLSLLLRPGEWSVRASAGGGYHVPTHRIEEVEPIGLAALGQATELAVERARAVSLDVGREIGEVEINLTAFGSIVDDAVALRFTGAPVVANVPGRTRTWGGELLARAHLDPIHATATYAYTRATEPEPDGVLRRDVPMTPRHAAGIVAMYEMEGAGRIGAEFYFTGVQLLHDNPYRNLSRPYAVFGVLAERRFGPARLFINFENIGDVRQTRYDPLLLRQPARDGRRTTDAWAPLDGRVVNGGVRLAF
jgi:outer membrane receptor for ferrienterochelin and colicins